MMDSGTSSSGRSILSPVIPSSKRSVRRPRNEQQRMRTSLFGQLRSLLYRAYLLKRRTLAQTLMEVFLMGIFSLMATAVGFYFKPVNYSAANRTTFYNSTRETDEILRIMMSNNGSGKSLVFAISPKVECESFKMAIIDLQRARMPQAMNQSEEIQNVSTSADSASLDKHFRCANNLAGLKEILQDTHITAPFGVHFNDYFNYIILYRAVFASKRNEQKSLRNYNCRDVDETSCMKQLPTHIRKCPSAAHCGTTSVQYLVNLVLLRCLHGGQLNCSRGTKPTLHPGEHELTFSFYPKPAVKAEVNSNTVLLMTLMMVLSTTPFVNFILVNVVSEKESRLKDGFKMMGMSDAAYGLSWFIVYSIQGGIGCLLSTGVLCLPKLGVFNCPSSAFAFFIGYFLYTESIVVLGLMLSTFFRWAVLAGIVGSLSNAIFALVYLGIKTATENKFCGDIQTALRSAYLVSSALFARYFEGLVEIQRDISGEQDACLPVGALFAKVTKTHCHPFTELVLFLLADMAIYSILTAYFDFALSGAYRGWKRWLFFLAPSFWCQRKLTPERIKEMLENPSPFVKPVNDIEAPPKSFVGKESVRFVSLRKEFNDGESVAVQGLTLDMYKDQITCLLGHNGAGKTTVINMMTGLIKPTYGTILVNGRDVTYAPDMAEIRRSMGICPQFDILYHHMTVKEHLRMVGYMKGGSRHSVNEAVNDMLAEFQLSADADLLITQCSLGTKRKVSVAMSLMFDPEIVFLDEPTSGMDPAARRHVWDVLKRRKLGKTILLTTHFMDEADILSDRKAIMSHGHMLCCGSSLFLKTRFGIGYTLHMSINPESKIKEITETVQKTIPTAKVVRNLKRELVFLLPLEYVPTFADLFRYLESSTDGTPLWKYLGVLSFGISMTTLEEVFLKLSSEDSVSLMRFASPVEAILQKKPPGHEETKEALKERLELRKKDPISHGGPQGQSVIDYSLILEHMDNMPVARIEFAKAFWSLMTVWFRLAIRNLYTVGYRALLPGVLVLVGFIVLRVGQEPKNRSYDPLSLMYTGMVRTDKCRLLWLSNVGSKCSSNGCDANITCDNQIGKFTVDFDSSANHMMPYATSLIFEGLFGPNCSRYIGTEACSKRKAGKPKFMVDVVPSGDRPELELSFIMIFSTILLGLGLLSPGPSFASEVVKARESRIAVMLSLNGIKFAQYWLSIFLAHFLQTLPIILLLPALAKLFSVEFLEDAGALLIFFLLSFTSMIQNILLCYVMSFGYDRSDSCMTMLPPTLFILGYVPFMLPAIMMLADKVEAAHIAHGVLCAIDPVYVVFGGILYISRASKMARIKNLTSDLSYYFSNENRITLPLGASLIHGAICILLLWVIESMRKSQSRKIEAEEPPRKTSTEEDHDVLRLRQYTKQQKFLEVDEGNAPLLVLDSVGLRYIPTRAKRIKHRLLRGCVPHVRSEDSEGTTAVDDLCLAVFPGEVFGLLGPSGAGKSSTLNLITGEKTLSSGEIWISGKSLSDLETRKMNMVGYCPETDALWDDMKLAEHLRFYSLINGLNSDQTQFVVNFLLDVLQIREHSNKLTKNLSGGTKRKVSFAMSTLRCPKVVLLDEPSTGMDPHSKRFLWDAIMLSFTGKRCAVLTTQSMEEAEYLCDRVGIIVKGQLKCVGSSNTLTDRYGTGYYLEIRAGQTQDTPPTEKDITAKETSRSDSQNSDLEYILGRKSTLEDKAAIKFVEENFSGSVLVEAVSDNMIFHIPRAMAPKLSHSFRVLENAKNSDPPTIREYSLSQASLEQVFLRFAKSQSVPGEAHEEAAEGGNLE